MEKNQDSQSFHNFDLQINHQQPQHHLYPNSSNKSYQCHCLMTFQNIEDFKIHIRSHETQYEQLTMNHLQYNQHVAKRNANTISQHIFSGEFGQKIQSTYNQQQKQHFHQNNDLNKDLINENKFQNLREINQLRSRDKNVQGEYEKLQKYNYFKYYQNYHKQKMLPFYRAFNIQPYIKQLPIKNIDSLPINNRDSLPLKDIDSLPLKDINYRYSHRTTQHEESTKDMQNYQQIEDQLYIKIIPTIKNLIEFVQSTYLRNYKCANVHSHEKNFIYQVLRQNISKLFQFTGQLQAMNATQNYIPYSYTKKDQDFMQSDLSLAITSFLNILAKNIHPQKIFIVESIISILIQCIFDYYQINQCQQALKVFQINNCIVNLNKFLQTNEQFIRGFIKEQEINRFLTLLNQWLMIQQYSYNKFNHQYILQARQKIDSINQIYRLNVQNYQKCISQRKFYPFKSKKIFKPKDLNSKSYNQNIVHDGTTQSNKQISDHITYEFKYDKNKIPHPAENIKYDKNKIERVQQLKSNRIQLLKNNSSSEIELNQITQRIQSEQYSRLNLHYKQKTPSSQLLRRKRDQLVFPCINLYPTHLPACLSKQPQQVLAYIEQCRKQQKQQWRQKISQLTIIMQDPLVFKCQMASKITQQLKVIDQLCCVSKQIVYRDPFIIKRNYRKRNYYFRRNSSAQQDSSSIKFQDSRLN